MDYYRNNSVGNRVTREAEIIIIILELSFCEGVYHGNLGLSRRSKEKNVFGSCVNTGWLWGRAGRKDWAHLRLSTGLSMSEKLVNVAGGLYCPAP